MAEPQTVAAEAPAAQPEYVAPPRIQVVTPDNFGAYVDERVPARPETPEEQEAELAEEDEEKKGATAADKPKKGKSNELQQRFSELTEQRKAAEKRAEDLAAQHKSEREARQKAENDAKALRERYEPPQPDELGPEPVPSQFSDVGEYGKALKDWTADSTRRDDARKAAEARAAAEATRIHDDWMKRQTAYQTETPDYEETVKNSQVQIGNDVRDAIFDSESGPQILYALAKDPELADKIAKMSVGRALKEIGKLEAKLPSGGTTQEGPKSAPAATVAEISRAPAPISPLRGTVAPSTAGIGSDGEFRGSFLEWKRLRNSGKIK